MGSAETAWRIGQANLEKRNYESRQTQVSNAKNKIPQVCNEHIDDINSKIDKVKTYLTSGISGLKINQTDVIANYCEIMDGLKEKDSESDSKLSEASVYLTFEISECGKKINELNDRISRLNTQYQNELAAEMEAARLAWEAAQRKAAEALGLKETN